MCIILSIYQKKKEGNVHDTLIQLYKEQRQVHKHGVAIVAYDKDEKEDYILRVRSLDVSSYEMRKILESYDIVHIHLRQATAGAITKENCHFWSKKGWTFAHNGMVYGVIKNGLTDKKTDSEELFDILISKKLILKKGSLKFDAIREYISNISFWGRFILLNEQTKKMYYFGDFHSYTLGDETMVVSSTSLEFTSVFSLFGLLFEDKSVPVREMNFEGIYSIDPINETAREIHLGDIERGFKYTIYGKDLPKTEPPLFTLNQGEQYAGLKSSEQEEMNDNMQRELNRSGEDPNDIPQIEEALINDATHNTSIKKNITNRQKEIDIAMNRAEKARAKRERKAKKHGKFHSPKVY